MRFMKVFSTGFPLRSARGASPSCVTPLSGYDHPAQTVEVRSKSEADLNNGSSRKVAKARLSTLRPRHHPRPFCEVQPLLTGEASLCLSVYAWESGGAIGELVEAMTFVLSERDATTLF